MGELRNPRTRGPVQLNRVVVAGLLCAVGSLVGMTTPSLANNPPPSPPADQAVGQDGTQTTAKSVAVVNTTLEGIRDRHQSTSEPTAPPTQFSADGLDELGLEALGYSPKRARITSNPLYKAPPKPVAAASKVIYSGWGQTYVDREWRDASNGGIDFGRKSTTVGGVVGFDAIITNVRTSNDAVVLGVLGSETSSTVKGNDRSKTHLRGPGVGAYAAYVVGQYSVDAVYKADFLDLTRKAPSVANLDLGMTNHIVALNFNNKIPIQKSWWIEPTVGFSRSRLIWNDSSRARGFVDGSEWRVQGGARTGTSFTWNKVRVEPTLAAIAYSPVSIEGGSVPVAAGQPTSPLDKGKLFGQTTGKMNFVFSPTLSSYVEGEVRGTSGVLGAAGRIGVRKVLHQ